MKLPANPRSDFEASYYIEAQPCESCGHIGMTDVWKYYAEGTYRGRCPKCSAAREYSWTPPANRKLPPPFELGAGTSTLLSAAMLRAIADRDLTHVPPDPTQIPTVAIYETARVALVHARTAVVELAKHDRAAAKQAATLEKLWDQYVAAEAVVNAKSGAQPAPIGLDSRFKQHRDWLARGRRGDGQLVFRNETWKGLGWANPLWTGAIVENSTFERIDLSYGTFDGIRLVRSKLLGCSLSACELKSTEVDHCDFRGSSLGMGHIIDVVVKGGDWSAIFAGRGMWKSRFEKVDLHDANLRDARLDGSVFDKCDFRNVDFSRDNEVLTLLCTARGTRFVDCDLRGANVQGWRLDGAHFERCKLGGLRGKPVFEGAPTRVIAADISAAGDGSGITEKPWG